MKMLPDLLKNLTFFKVTKWGSASSDNAQTSDDERHPVDTQEEANVVTSKRKSWFYPHHALLLDLDIPAWQVPSSTPGHSHLYVDVSIPEPLYWKLLDVLAECGVVTSTYVKYSKMHGGTTLRLPGVLKEGAETNISEDIWDMFG